MLMGSNRHQSCFIHLSSPLFPDPPHKGRILVVIILPLPPLWISTVVSLCCHPGKRHWDTLFHDDSYKTLTTAINAFSLPRGTSCACCCCQTPVRYLCSIFGEEFKKYSGYYYKLLWFLTDLPKWESCLFCIYHFLVFFILMWQEPSCIQCRGGFSTSYRQRSLPEQGFSNSARLTFWAG